MSTIYQREVRWTAGKLDEVAASFDPAKADQVEYVRRLMKEAADLIRRLAALP
jgi:hypothetical protein